MSVEKVNKSEWVDDFIIIEQWELYKLKGNVRNKI